MSRRKRAQNLGRSTSQISPLITHEKQKAPPSKSSTSTSLSIAVSKSKKNDIKQRNQKSKDENTPELSESSGSLPTTSSLPRPSQGRRKRASSVEWDWSGSESNDTPKVPLNKKAKLSMRRKRTPSVDSEWRSSGSESDNCSASNSNKQGFFSNYFHACIICIPCRMVPKVFQYRVKISLLYLQSTQIMSAICVIKSLPDHGDCVCIYNNILIQFVAFLCSCCP